jgi:uncharacterized NAD(P)/FAD-binding protein YdhS
VPAQPPSMVFVGGGPRTAGLLERLAANLEAGQEGPLDIHVVEPHQPGSGRIWRLAQDPGLLLNSTAADVTMFTDSSVLCEGPPDPGPSLIEWAKGVLDGSVADAPEMPPHLQEQLRSLQPGTFPTRQLHSRYLEWFFRRAVRRLQPKATVTVHQDTAVDVERNETGFRLRLAGGKVLQADVLVLAIGHTDAQPGGTSVAWSDFAARHGAIHLPPSYTADVDYAAVPAGQDVLVSGMGLAFVDLLVILMEGRGGRFVESGGDLRYLPSGREPRLWAGSRRGVPYHSKVSATLRGLPHTTPRFLTPAAVAALLHTHGELDFKTHLWPLIAKDLGYAYYQELFAARPEAMDASWQDFSTRFEDVPWYSAERERLVADAVPDPLLHLDLERLDQPLAGMGFSDSTAVQQAVTNHIEQDLLLRTGPDHSETLALFLGLLGTYMELGRLVLPEQLNARSQRIVQGWWHGFFSFVDSGPPPERLRQMLALQRAGLLSFLGPGLNVDLDEQTGCFTAWSAQGGTVVRSRVLIEARLPAPALVGTANPLLHQLHSSGLGQEQLLLTADGLQSTGRLLVDGGNALLDPMGEQVPGLFAVGPGTSGWASGAFARPGTNAAPFRENDALARRLLVSAARTRQPAMSTPEKE